MLLINANISDKNETNKVTQPQKSSRCNAMFSGLCRFIIQVFAKEKPLISQGIFHQNTFDFYYLLKQVQDVNTIFS